MDGSVSPIYLICEDPISCLFMDCTDGIKCKFFRLKVAVKRGLVPYFTHLTIVQCISCIALSLFIKKCVFNTSLLQAVAIIQLILTLCITCVPETSFMQRTCGTPLSDRFNKEACFLLCCYFPRNDEKRQKWIQATYYVPRIPFVSLVFLNL